MDTQFRVALRLLDRALADPDAPPDLAAATAFVARVSGEPSLAPAAAATAAPSAAPAAGKARPPLSATVPSRLTLRDMLERLAGERGLALLPKAGRPTTPDGKPLYTLGALTVYLDQDVVFVRDGARFVPTPLDDALAAAARGGL